MLINSIEFLIFLLGIVLIYKIVPKKVKWLVLLISSYIFYFSNSTYLILCMLFTTLSIYLVALKIGKIDDECKKISKTIDDKEKKKKIKQDSKKNKKRVLVFGILLNLAVLIFIKYSGFIGEGINSLFKILHIEFNIPLKEFILPLGISYYTLQAISYIVDVYRGKIKADKNIGRVALFLAFFPQLVEGPIGRYDKLANNLYEPHEITYKNICFGTQLMLWGFFKKMVIADRVAMYANEVFNNYTAYSGPIIVLGALAYTLQIYTEFSGGIDIVRGAAEIFDIHLDQNFERPFFARSIDEFWRRWNITLGTWLKDYVFYPVSLSKASVKVTNVSKKIFKDTYLSKLVPIAFSLLFVWLCNGIWHGAGAKYIVYGLYYYVIMMLGKIFAPLFEKIIKIFKINTKVWSYKLFQILRTDMFVCIGMTIFRAENLRTFFEMVKSIVNVHNLENIFNGKAFMLGGLNPGDIAIIVISSIILLVTSIYKEKGLKFRESLAKQNLIFRWIVLYALIFIIIIFGIYGKGYNIQSFIYGQF